MTPRQLYAFAHPITEPRGAADLAYRRVEPQPDGNLLVSVLAAGHG